MRLSGRIAVITGAAGLGIGRAIATAFAREGADIAVLDTRPAQETLALVTAARRRALGLRVDVGDPAQAASALAEVTASLGPIGVLVNAAAVLNRKPFLELTVEDWDRVHRVDLRGYFVVGQWVARDMVRHRRRGSIINIASTSSTAASPNLAHYCAAKGGVLMLTRCMALELAPHGIRVNAISPGTIETDLNRDVLANAEHRRARAETIPLGRIGVPQDVAGAAVLLASDEGGFMVGANVVVDGGLTVRA